LVTVVCCKSQVRVRIAIIYVFERCFFRHLGPLHGLTGSTLDHRSLPPEFESRHGHIWRVFHLWLHFITFGGRSAHLAYHVHKSGCKTSISSSSCFYLLSVKQINFFSWNLMKCKRKNHSQHIHYCPTSAGSWLYDW